MTYEVYKPPTKIDLYTGLMTHYVIKGEVLNSIFGSPSLGTTVYVDTQFYDIIVCIQYDYMTGDVYPYTFKQINIIENHHMKAFLSAWDL